MALDTPIVHPESGGAALVEWEAFDKIYSRKGWKIATVQELHEESQRLIEERDKALTEQAEASAQLSDLELAAAGALPQQAAEPAQEKATAKKSAAPPA